MATYAPPSVTVISQGASQQLIGGVPGKTLLLLGTAPKGPDTPVLIPLAQLASIFGDPGQATSTGYSIPLGGYYASIQRQPTTNSAYNLLVCRTGVTRATAAVVAQTSGTSFNLVGIGMFAGSAGNALKLTVTVAATVVTQIQILNGTTVLQTYANTSYDLTSNAKIQAAINGANPLNNPGSAVQVTGALGANIPAAVVNQALAGGADGLGTAAGDASVAAALANSLAFSVDYIWAGFDASTISGALSSHITAALSINQFRKAILGPALGTTFASLSTSYNNMNSSRFVCIGHDGAFAVNPATGTTTIYDGIYLAAAYAGLKAVGPTEETATRFPIAGFSGLAIPSDKTAPLQTTDLNLLAAAGLLVFEQPASSALLLVRDAVSTAPYTLGTNSNLVNPFYQFNVQDIDDAVSLVTVAAVSPFKGRPSPNLATLTTQLQAAVRAGLARLGSTINGVNSVTVSVDPNTLIYAVTVSYITRFPITTISIVTSFTFI